MMSLERKRSVYGAMISLVSFAILVAICRLCIN